jgi:hypothetical protein
MLEKEAGRAPVAAARPLTDYPLFLHRADRKNVSDREIRSSWPPSRHVPLAQLLARERGVCTRKALAPLTEDKIVRWARTHRRLTGRWPTEDAGPIPGTRGVTVALRRGTRNVGALGRCHARSWVYL